MLLRGEGSEELKIGMGMRGEGAGDALEFPEGFEAGEQRRDPEFASAGGEVLGGDGGAVGEDDGAVGFALGDHFDELAVLLFGAGGDDGARGGFGFEYGGDVGFLALEDVVVHDEVGEDEAVEAVGAGGVEGAVTEPAGGVDCGEGVEIEVGGDDHVERGEVGGRPGGDGFDIDVERYPWVELAYLGCCGLGSLRRCQPPSS